MENWQETDGLQIFHQKGAIIPYKKIKGHRTDVRTKRNLAATAKGGAATRRRIQRNTPLRNTPAT